MKFDKVTQYRPYLLFGLVLLALLVASGSVVQLVTAATPPGDPAVRSYGNQLQPLATGDGTLNIRVPDGRIEIQTGPGGREGHYSITDHLGSVRVTGGDAGPAEYGPHGEVVASGINIRYAGHPYDGTQGLYETPRRSYDPVTGRFLSPDPQRQDAGPYAYAGNDPIGYVDLTGGVRVPYFMKSGWKDRERYLSRSTAELLGIHPDQRISNISTFKKGGKIRRSTTRLGVGRFLYGQTKAKKKRTFSFDDRFFWIMGNEEGVPDDLHDAFSTVRGRRPHFGKKMVLLNFQSEEHGTRIQGELDAAGQSNLLITSKLISNVELHSKASRPRLKAFEVAGQQLSPDEFGAYVRKQMAENWPPMEVSIALSKLPPDTRSALQSGSLISDPTPGGSGVGQQGPDALGGASPRPSTSPIYPSSPPPYISDHESTPGILSPVRDLTPAGTDELGPSESTFNFPLNPE